MNKEKSKKVQKPYKTREAEVYALWMSIPTTLKRLPKEQIRQMGFEVDDEVFNQLLEIHTKTDFSKIFKVSAKQLTRWDDCEEVKENIRKFNLMGNVLRFKKDIDFHFTQKTIKEADAGRVKLWKELYEGWEKGDNVEHKQIIVVTNKDPKELEFSLVKDEK